MEKQRIDKKENQLIIAMKGHPGTGKSTLAKSIARKLKFPLVDKDHLRGCTREVEEKFILPTPESSKLLNDLSYEVMWHVASTQLNLGLSVVVDSPLSRRFQLDRLLELAAANRTNDRVRVIIIECKPKDEGEWRARVEKRGLEDETSWHKPKTWAEMEKLLDIYGGCWDYDVGGVPKFVVDTTANVGAQDMLSSAIDFIESFRYSC